jgi:agmatine deiminase
MATKGTTVTPVTERAGAFMQPAEWEPHDACWLAWPSHAEPWEGAANLAAAQAEFTGLCRAIAGDATPSTGERAERLEVHVPDAACPAAAAALAGLPVRIHDIPFGDIWLRDTAPVFVRSADGRLAAARFRFTGWGGKYISPHDDAVAAAVVDAGGFRDVPHAFVLEGGSVDSDGEGTCLTTRQCLLNPNRNPGQAPAQLEALLKQALGAVKVLWLDEGLINDHTDGHIDTIARFVGPARVLCMHPASAADPNAATLERIRRSLESFTDARGRRLEVVTVPSPGAVRDDGGRLMPASYAKVYIGTRTVVVPTYGAMSDAEAVRGIAELFPDRRTVGAPAKAILGGGGAFHCITQQQPRV